MEAKQVHTTGSETEDEQSGLQYGSCLMCYLLDHKLLVHVSK